MASLFLKNFNTKIEEKVEIINGYVTGRVVYQRYVLLNGEWVTLGPPWTNQD